MLDEASAQLLSALSALIVGGGYKIVEEGELAPRLPLTGEELTRSLALLEEKRLIDVRYAEGGAFCLRLLPAGRSYAERVERERLDAKKRNRESLLYAALGAFLGGALSGAAVLLLSLLV